MTANRDRTDRTPQEHFHKRVHRHVENGSPEVGDRRSQGIVRDQRGQEQPADKERAQRVHKTG